jgi:hypothetical protein
MAWIATAIAAAGTIYSAVSGADASRRATNTQADAARNAAEQQRQQFEQSRADLTPWRQGGGQGLDALLKYLGIGGQGGYDPNAPGVRPFGTQDFQTDPGYQFRLKEGQNALLNQASRLGGFGGGNTTKALIDYNQNAASGEYQNAFNRYRAQQGDVYNRYNALSNTGANTAGQIANLGASATDDISSLGLYGGMANASGILGQQQAVQQGINAFGPALSKWLSANNQQQSGYTGQLSGSDYTF